MKPSIFIKSSNLPEQSGLDIKNENSANSNQKKIQDEDHTRFGDWVINGRTIDFQKMYKKFIKFLKYFSVFIIIGFLSSCLFFTEKNYYKGPISDHFNGDKFLGPYKKETNQFYILIFYNLKSYKSY